MCIPCLTTVNTCDRLEVFLQTDVEKLRVATQKQRQLFNTSAAGDVLTVPKIEVGCESLVNCDAFIVT